MTPRFTHTPKAKPDVVGILQETVTDLLLAQARKKLGLHDRVDTIGLTRELRVAAAARAADELRRDGHEVAAELFGAGDGLTFGDLVAVLDVALLHPDEVKP